MLMNYPILEFDPSEGSIIDPDKVIKGGPVPRVCIFPLLYHVIQNLRNEEILKEIIQFESIVKPPTVLYNLEYHGKDIAVLSSAIGAPFAAANLEIAIALGCKYFLVIGTCGVLDSEIERNQIIIPNAAIRDEGTSYHYSPPSRKVEVNPDVVNKIHSYLIKRKIESYIGTTWTTDAYFRETFGKIKKRKGEGAISVEMEAAALIAVAEFRKIKLGYILSGGDDISGLEWDRRLQMGASNFHEKLFWLAADICIEIF